MIEPTDQRNDQLRQLTMACIRSAAALAPHTIGNGVDANGVPLPGAEETINGALDGLVEAGQLAQALLQQGGAR